MFKDHQHKTMMPKHNTTAIDVDLFGLPSVQHQWSIETSPGRALLRYNVQQTTTATTKSFIMALFSSRKLLDFDTVALSLLFEN